jgi:sarcosine oxidase subunit gamma
MAEHPGFNLRRIDGRSMVRLRVRPNGAVAAGTALQLPQQAMQWRSGDPAACWLGPDQWLLTSDTRLAEELVGHIDRTLSNLLHAATDMSSHNACFALKGPAARTVLAMGCGIDMHESAFISGQCVRTQFANVQLLIVAVADNRFDLYLDRSHARYLSNWIANAGEDPITRDTKHPQNYRVLE